MSKFSYLSTPRASPYKYECVTDILRSLSENNPDDEGFIYRGIDGSRESLTYKQLNNKARKFAKFLVQKGIEKGDKLALLGSNTLEWIIGQTAIVMAGGVAVSLSLTRIDSNEIWKRLIEIDCRALLIDPGKDHLYDSCVEQLQNLLKPKENNKYIIITFRKISESSDVVDLKTILDLEEDATRLPQLCPEDPMVIYFTSGSTGKPKLVQHTHFHMMNIADYKAEKQASIIYNDRPFGWYGGSPMMFICARQTRVFCDSSIAIDDSYTMLIWNMIKEENCSQASLPPYFVVNLIKKRHDYKDSFQLKVIFVGGQVIDTFYSCAIGVFTNVLIVTYGMTEAGLLSWNPVTTRNKIETGLVGKPVQGIEIKVIDVSYNIVSIGHQGEICVRSNRLFDEYLHDEQSTKEAFLPGRWFRTGDTGFLTEDGQIVIDGRIKDTIIRGSRKITTNTIEQVVMEMKGISHVAAIAVPDKILHEEICVCYTQESGHEILPKDVEEFCNIKFSVVESHDGIGILPKYFLKMNSFPLLSNAKPDKTKMKEYAICHLGIEI